MKTVVGVDLGERYLSALKLCLALKFREQTISFVHSVEVLPEYSPPLAGSSFNTDIWMTHLREAGESALAAAEALAKAEGLPSETTLVNAPASTGLLSVADAGGADLIAVGSLKRGKVGSFVAGSVARATTIAARQSLLVTKSEWNGGSPTRAVFATDHSDYANRALDLLLEWVPKGIAQIDVVTAFEATPDHLASVPPRHFLLPVDWSKIRAATIGTGEMSESDGQIESVEAVESRLEEKCQAVADKISAAGYKSEAKVVKGHPNEALAEHMQTGGADLLILGAQGHGFVERLLIGSVSLHQVITEPYPVLVLRP